MAKQTRPAHAVQQAADAATAPAPAPAPEKPADPAPDAPEWGWTVALIVWGLAFGGLAIYELWTGMVSKLFWRR
ncbi:MAG: hypothetical protein K2W96_02295 [Gemmataceae bacterium]|nr:hypothetical protein [Gemmataceae bacterium]